MHVSKRDIFQRKEIILLFMPPALLTRARMMGRKEEREGKERQSENNRA